MNDFRLIHTLNNKRREMLNEERKIFTFLFKMKETLMKIKKEESN